MMFSAVKRYGVLLCVICVQAVVACAPDHARAIREDRSLTLGLPGVAYRPNGSMAIGTTFGATKESPTLNTAETGADALNRPVEEPEKIAIERKVEQRSVTLSPFIHYYPWDDSAFFIGVAGNYTTTKSTYREETEGSTALAPTFTEIVYNTKSSYVGMPIGWAWIWDNGISFIFDFGPRVLVNQASSYSNDGLEQGVDEAKRDRTAEVIDSVESPLTFGGSGILGYSF